MTHRVLILGGTGESRELAGRLGDAWQDDWLAQVASVRRDLLRVALSDDPAAATEPKAVEKSGRTRRERCPSLQPDLYRRKA